MEELMIMASVITFICVVILGSAVFLAAIQGLLLFTEICHCLTKRIQKIIQKKFEEWEL